MKYTYLINLDTDGDHNYIINNIDSSDLPDGKFILQADTLKGLNDKLLDLFTNIEITRSKPYIQVQTYFNVMESYIKHIMKYLSDTVIEFYYPIGNQSYDCVFINDVDNFTKDDINTMKDLEYNTFYSNIQHILDKYFNYEVDYRTLTKEQIDKCFDNFLVQYKRISIYETTR